MMDCLIVGLGNPGKQYHGTRHNIGYDALEAIAKVYDIQFNTGPHYSQSLIAKSTIAGKRILLVKPTIFMNQSGISVAALSRYYTIASDNIFILYDDLDLPSGTIRLKSQGGTAGHNGIKSVQQHLGTDAFKRVRIGIDRPKRDAVSYVLTQTTRTQRVAITTAISKLTDSVALLVTDFKRAQQLFHTTIDVQAI